MTDLEQFEMDKLKAENVALKRQITMALKMFSNRNDLEICNFIKEVVDEAHAEVNKPA